MKKQIKKTKETQTSWGKEALWYDNLLSKEDTYQSKVILPNLLRVVGSVVGKTVVELGCGQGLFSIAMALQGAKVIGIDVGEALIKKANQNVVRHNVSSSKVSFYVGDAQHASMIADKSADIVMIILALQNIKDLSRVIQESSRILKKGGRVVLVLNHPVFRIPQFSDWGFDMGTNRQYRKVFRYLSQTEINIDMHPGQSKKVSITKSFHRSLQDYMKVFAKEGFVLCRLEEWISHKESEHGPRKQAEDIARKEIPLFMMMELVQR